MATKGVASQRSTITAKELEAMRSEFPSYTFRIPRENETPFSYVEGELCVYLEHFKFGFSLPLPMFLVVFCNYIKVVPTMLTLNSMAILHGLSKFFRVWSVDWEVKNFMSLITFVNRDTSVLYAQDRHSKTFGMTGVPTCRWSSFIYLVM